MINHLRTCDNCGKPKANDDDILCPTCKPQTIYQKNGYKDRAEYLYFLAQSTGIDADIVNATADLLGENEDFDGLVTSLEDYIEMYPDDDEQDDYGYETQRNFD